MTDLDGQVEAALAGRRVGAEIKFRCPVKAGSMIMLTRVEVGRMLQTPPPGRLVSATNPTNLEGVFLMDLTCRACGFEGLPDLYWHPLSNGAAHLGARCARCAAWIKWVPQTSEWLEHAPLREA